MSGLRFGNVVEQDPDGNRVRVQLDDQDGLKTWWIGVLSFGTGGDSVYVMPDIGEHVAVMLDQHGEDGVLLGSRNSAKDRPKINRPEERRIDFADGSFLRYDREKHELELNVIGAGKITLVVGDTRIELTKDMFSLMAKLFKGRKVS
jgi:phage baseplate assembly protein V